MRRKFKVIFGRIFSKNSSIGWIIVILGNFRFLNDLWDSLTSAWTKMNAAGSILSSPYVAPILTIVGIVWIAIAATVKRPKLSITPGEPVPNSGNVLFPLKVENVSWSDKVTGCLGTLTQISRKGIEKPIWGDRRVRLAFAPSEDDDYRNKTIRTWEFLDVVFLAFDPSLTLEQAHQTGSIQVKPGTKDWRWNYKPAFEDIFDKTGEYLLKIEITGDGVDPITKEIKFNNYGKDSSLEIVS